MTSFRSCLPETMYVVAISRWGAPLEAELAAFAKRLGVLAYDARLRLAGPLPVVVESTSDAEAARALLEWLRARGHGGVACDADAVVPAARMIAPRAFRLEPDVFAGGEAIVPWDVVIALVRAAHDRSREHHQVATTRELSLGRAALTGGLSLTKKRSTERHEVQADREQVLYVYRSDGGLPLLLLEHRVRYDGLGDQRVPTTGENFQILVTRMRAAAPGAFYDERLVTDRRRATTVDRTGTSKDVTVATSNAAATDRAAHLLALAHLRGQL